MGLGGVDAQPGTRTSYGTMLWGKENAAPDTVDKAQSLVRAARSDGLEVKVCYPGVCEGGNYTACA